MAVDTIDIHTVIHENILMVSGLNSENLLRGKNLMAVLAIPLEMIDDGQGWIRQRLPNSCTADLLILDLGGLFHWENNRFVPKVKV